MNAFVEQVLATINAVAPDEDGIRKVIYNSYAEINRKSVFMHSTEDLCALLSDSRIPWHEVMVEDPHSSTLERSLLSTALETWHFSNHLDVDDQVLELLRKKFEPQVLCQMLAQSMPMAMTKTFVGGGIDQRHILLERLAWIISSDKVLIETWVDLLFKEHRARDAYPRFIWGRKNLSQALPMTQAYEALDPGHATRKALPLAALTQVAILAAAFKPVEMKLSLARYTQANLYRLSEASLVGAMGICSNTIRNAFLQALYLLNDVACEHFIPSHLGRAPIKENDQQILPALISACASAEKPCYHLSAMVGTPARPNREVLKVFIRDYLFRWRSDFADRTLSEVRNASLRQVLSAPEMADLIFDSQTLKNIQTPQDCAVIKKHYEGLPQEIKFSVLERMWATLERGIAKSQLEGLSGIATCLITIGSQENRMHKVVRPRLGKMLRLIHDKNSPGDWLKFLKVAYEGGVLDASAIARRIPNADLVSVISQTLGIEKQDLMKDSPKKVSEQALGIDLGL